MAPNSERMLRHRNKGARTAENANRKIQVESNRKLGKFPTHIVDESCAFHIKKNFIFYINFILLNFQQKLVEDECIIKSTALFTLLT